VKGQRADAGVDVALAAVALLGDIVGLPPGRGLVAARAQLGDQRSQGVVVGIAGRREAQERDRLPARLLPVGVKGAGRGIAEDEPRLVALRAEGAQQGLGSGIPDEQVKAPAQQDGGRRLELLDDELEPGPDERPGVAATRGVARRREPEQVAALDLVEQQTVGQRLEDVGRGAADASLLESHDVVDADVREARELLTAQAGHAPARACVEPHELGRNPRPAGSHELTELLGALQVRNYCARAILVRAIPGKPVTGWVVGGTYRFVLRRDGERWRIVELKRDTRWQTGDSGVLARAASRSDG
jgi:hypothetical protein